MDWINDRIDKLIGIVPTNPESTPTMDRRLRRLARCGVAWKRLGDALCGDVARFSGRNPQAIGGSVTPEQIHLFWADSSGTLLLVTRNPEDPLFTYSAPKQRPDQWLQHGGTITPRSETVFMVRDSTNSTEAMDLGKLSEFLLGPPLFGDIPAIRR